MNSLKYLFFTSRPISWINTAYPFAAGYLVTGGSIDIAFLLGTLYFLIPYNLLMYGVNDVYDYESDIRNPRKGGIEGSVIERSYHRTILRAAFLSNLPFLILLLTLGNFWANVILGAAVFFVIAYSLGGLRFKEKPFLDSITSSIHFVGPLLYGISLSGLAEAPWPIIVAFFLWGAASHALGAVQDIIPDRKGSIASIATRLGARPTLVLVQACYLSAIAVLLSYGGLITIAGLAGLIYPLNVLPYMNVTDSTSGKVHNAWRRFVWINYLYGFIVTMLLIAAFWD